MTDPLSLRRDKCSVACESAEFSGKFSSCRPNALQRTTHRYQEVYQGMEKDTAGEITLECFAQMRNFPTSVWEVFRFCL